MEGGRADSRGTERVRKTEELKMVWSPNKTVQQRRVSEKELKQRLDPGGGGVGVGVGGDGCWDV